MLIDEDGKKGGWGAPRRGGSVTEEGGGDRMVRKMRQDVRGGCCQAGMDQKRSTFSSLEELGEEPCQGKAGFRWGEGRKLVRFSASSCAPPRLPHTSHLTEGCGAGEGERRVLPQTPRGSTQGLCQALFPVTSAVCSGPHPLRDGGEKQEGSERNGKTTVVGERRVQEERDKDENRGGEAKR